jgi:acetyl-CoA carboxylase biotin carboxyl carrier protein
VTLTAKDVAEITRLLEESSFDELDLELDGLKLSLRRGTAAAAAPAVVPAAAASSPVATPAAAPSSAVASAGAGVPSEAARTRAPGAATDPDVHEVPAPLLGTFYRAPKPGAPPFIEIGSRVEEETIIGIIEVMKLMNTVRAGIRGRVSEIPGRDGALVEYGETLVRISTTG